jgi:hypothetical protein
MALGSIIALTPAAGFAWPALLPAALLAASHLGYQWVEDPKKSGLPVLNALKRKLLQTRLVTLDLRQELANREKPINVEVVEEELQSDQQMVWTRDEVTLIFRKDARGRFFIDAMGPAKMTDKELKARASEFAREMVRNFAVNRVVQELEKANVAVVDEKIEEGDVVIKLRRWV